MMIHLAASLPRGSRVIMNIEKMQPLIAGMEGAKQRSQ